MRPLLAIGLMAAWAATAATAQASEGVSESTQIDLVKWAITQGALALVLLVVLWSYRRDFFRKMSEKDSTIELLQEQNKMLAGLIKENTSAAQSQALATAANTQATQALATNIDRLERSITS